MPPVKLNGSDNLKKWALLDKNLSADINGIFCKICSKCVHATKKYHVTQHLASGIHMKHLKNKTCQQQNIRSAIMRKPSQTGPQKSTFATKLCEALVAANIPFNKLNNSTFRTFLQTYTNEVVPDESTLRKNYLNECYESKITIIREDIADHYIFISIDETIDCRGRYIANFIVCKLSENERGVPHLLASKELEGANHKTIVNFCDDSMRLLYPSGPKKDKVLLFVSDAAPYMIKAVKVLKIFYPQMMHITCLAHGLHRTCEFIRDEFNVVNSLISSTKKIFVKAPLRVAAYKKKLPNVPLPPEPVLTRWGTWIEACIFYATHFETIKEVVDDFDESASQATKKAQEAFKSDRVKSGLIYIKSNFSFVPDAIRDLETRKASLVELMDIFNEAIMSFEKAPGPFGKKCVQKLRSVIAKNPDFQTISEVAKIHKGHIGSVSLSVDQIAALKYAPVTSCEVERSFSHYKQILSDRRLSFLQSNLEKHLVCSWNVNQ